MIDFSGKVLLLTGANGAIGRAVAQRFHSHGAACVLTDLDEDSTAVFAHKLDPGGARAVALPQDATQAGDAARVPVGVAALADQHPFLAGRKPVTARLDRPAALIGKA